VDDFSPFSSSCRHTLLVKGRHVSVEESNEDVFGPGWELFALLIGLTIAGIADH
jgi:hypothetical protein